MPVHSGAHVCLYSTFWEGHSPSYVVKPHRPKETDQTSFNSNVTKMKKGHISNSEIVTEQRGETSVDECQVFRCEVMGHHEVLHLVQRMEGERSGEIKKKTKKKHKTKKQVYSP